MAEGQKQFAVIGIIGVVLFYGIPVIGQAIPAESGMVYFILVLLVLNPIYCFASNFLFTLKNGFTWYLPVSIGALFAPTVFIFYNESAAFYILLYMMISLIGSVAGYFFQRKIRKHSPNNR